MSAGILPETEELPDLKCRKTNYKLYFFFFKQTLCHVTIMKDEFLAFAVKVLLNKCRKKLGEKV